MKTFRQLLEDDDSLELDETTGTGQGVGDYSPKMNLQGRNRVENNEVLKKQMGLMVNKMDRKKMLATTRKMGLTLHHLKDEDIKKTILSMSLRNKRKFMGVANGTGSGDPANTGIYKSKNKKGK
jgi:hypothetical protein